MNTEAPLVPQIVTYNALWLRLGISNTSACSSLSQNGYGLRQDKTRQDKTRHDTTRQDEFIPPSVGGIGWLRPLLFFKGREVPVLLLETNSISQAKGQVWRRKTTLKARFPALANWL